MTLLESILKANSEFIEQSTNLIEEEVSRYPKRKLAVVTCMDTRLVLLKEEALGLNRGDVKVIKNAGNSVAGPFSETIRSLVIAIFSLYVEEIIILGHYDCGVAHASSKDIIDKMLSRNISEDAIKLIEEEMQQWLDNYKDPVQNIKDVVKKIYNNPLIPKDVPIHGLLIDHNTGKLKTIVNGYEQIANSSI